MNITAPHIPRCHAAIDGDHAVTGHPDQAEIGTYLRSCSCLRVLRSVVVGMCGGRCSGRGGTRPGAVSTPVFGGFAGVQLGREEGPWRGFGLLGWGRQGRGWGWGELPGSPGGSPRQVPGPLVALRVTIAVAERAGSARLRSVCGLGKGCGRCVSVSGTDDDCDEKMTIVRAEVRGARTPPTRAGARVRDSPRTKSHRPLTFRTRRGRRDRGDQRSGGAVTGGLVAGTLTGSTPATVLVRAHYPGALPR
jgi:hypothetical protein